LRDRTQGIREPGLRCRQWFARLVRNTRGQEMVEYAVFVGLVALVSALALPAIVERVTYVLNTVHQSMPVSDPTNCASLNPGAHGGRSPCAQKQN